MENENHIAFHETLDPETRKQWIGYWESHDHTNWRQHPDCLILDRNADRKIIYVVGRLNDLVAFVGAFTHGRGRPWIGCPEVVCLRGPLFDNVEFARWCLLKIHEHFQSRTNVRTGSIRIGPYWKFPQAETLERTIFSLGYKSWEKGRASGRRSTGIVDIRPDAAALLKSFSKSTRYEINHATKLGIKLKPAQSLSEATEFFHHLDKMEQERGITRATPGEISAMAAILISNPTVGAIISAYRENDFLAGILLARGGKTGFTYKFVVSAKSRELYPTVRLAPLVFYHAMLWAKAHGCESVDLEGYSATDEGPADRIYINRYKAGFNPTPCETLGQYYFISSKPIYTIERLLVQCKRITRLPKRIGYRIRFAAKKISAERNAKQS